jgi:pimeloyl-ACP methyl ester carboxylesterase
LGSSAIQGAAFARVCSYDRSGAAWSDLGPKPRTMDQEAFDLHRLLTAAGERGPYVVVGQSIGGMVVRIFTEKYRSEIAAVVLVDAYGEDSQLFTNGKMQRMRLAAKDRPVPAPRTSMAATDGKNPAELQQIEAFVKKNIGNPKIRLTTGFPNTRSGFGYGRYISPRTMQRMTTIWRKSRPECMRSIKCRNIRSAAYPSLFLGETRTSTTTKDPLRLHS